MESQPAEIARFARAASRYCALVEESVDARPRDAFVWTLRSELAEILAAAFQLPDVAPNEGAVADGITLAQWSRIYGHVQLRVGELSDGPAPPWSSRMPSLTSGAICEPGSMH